MKDITHCLDDLRLSLNKGITKLQDESEVPVWIFSIDHKDLPFSFRWLHEPHITPDRDAALLKVHELYSNVLKAAQYSKASIVCEDQCFGTTNYTPQWDDVLQKWFVLKCNDTPIYESKNLPFLESSGHNCCTGYSKLDMKAEQLRMG